MVDARNGGQEFGAMQATVGLLVESHRRLEAEVRDSRREVLEQFQSLRDSVSESIATHVREDGKRFTRLELWQAKREGREASDRRWVALLGALGAIAVQAALWVLSRIGIVFAGGPRP